MVGSWRLGSWAFTIVLVVTSWFDAMRPVQNIANGFTGDPVPPSTGSGANVIANS